MRMDNTKDKGNRGSTLVLIVICASFIMLLTSVILSLTVTNRQMKTVDYRAKDNFYMTETAIDEIRVGLEEYVAKALEASYLKVMEQFIDNSELERRDIMRDEFLDNLEDSLCSSPGYYSIGLLENLLSDNTGFLISSGDNLFLRDDDSITLKNIRVVYEEDDGYLTTVSTDIVIHTQETTFSSSFRTPAFGGYSIIADKMIKLDATGLANGASINGSIYAGDSGIDIFSSRLDISNGSYIVTRGDIDVGNNSVLNINNKPSIWVKNIFLKSDTAEPFEISIDGKCYVADDLTIGGNNSRVRIQGEYYGYSYGYYGEGLVTPPLDAEASSAIIINGKNAGLELSDMDALLLAGRAFLSPDHAGDSMEVYTGESITVKDMQMAYLVPSDFLWCQHNPVTHEEYLAKPIGIPDVDYSRSSLFPINLVDYVDGFYNLHYIIHGQQYKYYYLKFQSETKANKYMQKYYELFRNGNDQLINIDDSMGKNVDSIMMDSTISNIFLTSGNILTYEAGSANLIDNNVDYGDPSFDAMKQMAIQLSKRYDSMKSNLEPISASPAYDENSVFNSIIDLSRLEIAPARSTYSIDLDGEAYYVHIINNPGATFYIADIPNHERHGMVIARGSVCVDKNYQGLILAAEEVELRPSVNVSASKNIVEGILRQGNSNINSYFRDYIDISAPETGSSSEGISVRNLIELVNWRKNE